MDHHQPPSLGALRSSITLTLHTFHAARIWRGRAAGAGVRPVMGMVGYIGVTNQLKQAAADDDPYADLAILKIEERIQHTRAALNDLNQQLETIQQAVPGQIAIGDNLNLHPVTLPLFVASPLGFLGVYLLTDYDVLARRTLLAHHTALIGQRDMAYLLDRGAHLLRGLFVTAHRCKPSGLRRAYFRVESPQAQAISARFGPLPADILSGERRSQYAPAILRGQAIEGPRGEPRRQAPGGPSEDTGEPTPLALGEAPHKG